jgi:hypothetical protein
LLKVLYGIVFINKQLKALQWCKPCELIAKRFKVLGFHASGQRRKLHTGELHNLYSSPDIVRQIISRRMRWDGHVALMGEGRNVYNVLVGKPEGKRPLERPSPRWDQNGP